jgi:hypothetical protein
VGRGEGGRDLEYIESFIGSARKVPDHQTHTDGVNNVSKKRKKKNKKPGNMIICLP